MKIALSLMDIVWEDKEANYRKAEQLAEIAYQRGAKLLILPEMSFTGFSMQVEKTAESAPYPTVEQMMALSKKYSGMAIAFGYARKAQVNAEAETYNIGESSETAGKAYNCLEIVCDGETLLHYKKIHPFTYGEEGKYFLAGSKLSGCEVCGVHLGGVICYDLRFPEVFQALSKESELILVPANWPQERIAHFRLLLQARAVENQCYVAGINRIGEGGGLCYEPCSVVFDPWGNELSTETQLLDGSEEGIVLAEIEPKKVWDLRQNFPLKKDRREDLYVQWYNGKASN